MSIRTLPEIELGILGRECLSRRIDKVRDLRHEVNAWERTRNGAGTKVNGQFRTQDARIRLARLYPSLE
jgi:hypothetical protein